MVKKVFSILLSFILLASQVDVTFGTHFCGGEAVKTKIMLGDTHLGCGIMDMEEPCDDSQKSKTNQVHFENVPCCENEYHTVQSTHEFVKDVTPQEFPRDTIIFDTVFTTIGTATRNIRVYNPHNRNIRISEIRLAAAIILLYNAPFNLNCDINGISRISDESPDLAPTNSPA